ncbi:flagellar biosynthesis protein FliQ [Pseudomonas putida]|uniref:Flagellar biosynthetic protein FliQ n=1 Tax=Pseudomonas putida TaxID=303 RepID=A0A8I1EC38_PSEPU|nr:flagellar biosynthesis protein FliQ [Pseudomonas putida]MBI6882553.1 flagellar biosynthesis protein FliQ [Pseudomonas putida]
MNQEMVMNLAYQGMKVAVQVGAPVLITLLVVGLLVSLFQAATQINEMTMSFIPKVIATLTILVIFGPMFIRLLVDFTRALITNIPNVIG